MKRAAFATIGILSLGMGTAAIAQTASPAAPAQQAAPGASSYSDAEIQGFVQAFMKVQEINQDTSMDQTQKQSAMVNAIEAAGLTPEKFNEIGQASQSDPALAQKIQETAGQMQGQ
ncbi:DUF4168 domain-containing protein [Altericroceibacterium spongiae]|uniref:DUF4168 domain-containing protein n=1 Tax=Altericroceibacterium spongiae TaxID=2320269 RepID=A0A420ERH4_9SPHN|nr:DUF4168 domain-containing protein [Altericroceibacterium spongiae]RKF23223.1 DUF4168 domain-containing protein [Altericroceibacterium spongiae]